ncbi:MAG: radical SAM/SPASM domain-containing protein [bacterium]
MRAIIRLFRLARILFYYRTKRENVGIGPIRLWFDTSARCNLRCVMCPNKELPASQKGLLSLDLFKKTIDEALPALHDIYLHHRGEPLLNPALCDMIRYARSRGVRTRFHSNGTLLTADWCARLLDARPDLISFSIDGFYKEAYEKVRIGANFEATLENVFRLLQMRRDRKQKAPYIVIEKIHFKNSTPPDSPTGARIKELARRFMEAGADEVIEKEEYQWSTTDAPEDNSTGICSRCTFPWYAMVISWDGTVTPCPQDFDTVMKMGNVSSASLRDIWNSPAYRELRRKHCSDISSLQLCRKCDRLRRKTVGGLPLQYMVTFLVDHLVGYNRLRKMLGTAERNV